MDYPGGFLDCMAFWDENVGIAYGDAVEEELFILRTEDGGESWTRIGTSSLPKAQVGEGGFAASGTCAATEGHSRGWVATGNGEDARVLYTEDRGQTWQATVTPVVGGPSAGLTTIGVGSLAMIRYGQITWPGPWITGKHGIWQECLRY